MICDDVPCSCYGTKKKRKLTPKQPVETQPPVQRASFTGAKKEEVASTGLDFETEQAIRNLNNAGLLSATDQAKYRQAVQPVPSTDTDRRLADWRKRNDLDRQAG